MVKRAWYIGCDAQEIGDRVILIGDPARIDRLANELADVHRVKENRGLRTITGTHDGVRITAAAFGMGGPIATIVMHELANLGAHTFLRIGTSMALPPVRLGEFLIATEAQGDDGASTAYGGDGTPVPASAVLVERLHRTTAQLGLPVRAGRFASFDGFYRDMFSIDAGTVDRVAAVRSEMQRQQVLVTDMETAALFHAARALGVAAGSLCLATVDSNTQQKIADDEMAVLERQLFRAALDTLAAA